MELETEWCIEEESLTQPSKLHDLIVELLIARSGLFNNVSIRTFKRAPTVDRRRWCLATENPGQDVQITTEKGGGIGCDLTVVSEHVRVRTDFQDDE